MKYPTFTMGERRYVIVPADDFAKLGASRPTATQRERKRRAELMRDAREHAGLTQAKLGELIGKSQPMVAGVEAGRVSIGERYRASVLAACGLPDDWTPSVRGAKGAR